MKLGSKAKRIFAATAAAVGAIILSFTGAVIVKNSSKSAQAYSTLPTGQDAAGIENHIGNIYNEETQKFDFDNTLKLVKKVGCSSLAELITAATNGTTKTSADFGNTVVDFGTYNGANLTWIPVYVSNSTEGAILTLWLAETDSVNSGSKKQEVSSWSDGTYANDVNQTYNGSSVYSNTYDGSYIRNYVLNGYTTYTGNWGIEKPISPPDAASMTKFTQFTAADGALSKYIVAPLNVSWQSSANYMSNDPLFSGANNAFYPCSWVNDKIWLPSVYETYDIDVRNTTTSFSGDGGLWKTSKDKRIDPTDNKSFSWLRNGTPNDKSSACILFESSALNQSVNCIWTVRPALHLNLNSVVKNLEHPEPTDVNLVYNANTRMIEGLTESGEIPPWYTNIKDYINTPEYSDDKGTVTSVINVGTYKVKIELLPDTGTFVGTPAPGMDETDTVRYITLTVNKREIKFKWKSNNEDESNFNYDYNGGSQVPDVELPVTETVRPSEAYEIIYKNSSGGEVESPTTVGSYTAAIKLSEKDKKNFTITEGGEQGFEIKAKQLTKDNITWDTTTTYTYDGTEQTYPTATYSVGSVSGDLIVELSKTFKDAGTYTFTLKTKAEDKNVLLPSAAADKQKDYTIGRAPLDIVWKSGTDAEFKYTNANPEMVDDLTGFITGEENLKDGFKTTLEGSVTYTQKEVTDSGAASLENDLNVGTNYYIKKSDTVAPYKITRATLQVHANSADIAKGDPVPKLTATLTGLKGGEGEDKDELQNAVNAKLTVKDYDPATSPTGKYSILLGSLETGTETGPDYVLKNYVIDYTGEKLTVTAGKLIITFEGHTAVPYGTSQADVLGSVHIAPNDKFDVSTLTIVTDYTAAKSAGTEYNFTVTFPSADVEKNYTVEYQNNIYTVQKRIITADNVTFSDFNNVIYDGKPHSVTAEINIEGLDITVPTLKVTYKVKGGNEVLESVTNAGTYTATAEFATAQTNWEFQTGNVATKEITITPAPLKISLKEKDYTVEYGEEFDINDIELNFDGTVTGEEGKITEAFEVKVTDDSGSPYKPTSLPSAKFKVSVTLPEENKDKVSNYKIEGIDKDTGVLTGANGTLEVLKKKINLKFEHKDLAFGGEFSGKLTDGILIDGKSYEEALNSSMYAFTFYFTPLGGQAQVIGDISQYPQVGEDGKINMMGKYTFTVALTDYGAARYEWAATALHENVALAEVAGDGTVRVSITAEGWTYGEAAKLPTVTTMPETDGGTPFTVEIEWLDGETWVKWTERQPVNAGTYSVRAQTKLSANYPASSPQATTFVIAPKTLTVKVAMNEENTEVKAGTAASELANLWTVTATGFVGKDTYDFTAFAENYSATTAAGTEINVKITRADLTGVLANYEIVYEENAKFTVIEDPEPVTPPVEDPPVEDPPTDDPNTDKPNEDDPKPVEPGVTDNDNDKGLPDGFPLWQVIVGGVSLLACVVLVANIVSCAGKIKKVNKKADKIASKSFAAGAMINGMLFGISDLWWTVIACSLAGVAVVLFIVLMIMRKALSNAQDALEEAQDSYNESEKRMLMMMMKNPQPGAGGYTVNIPQIDMDDLAKRVAAALLPNMQQAAAQLTAGGEYDDAELRRRLSEHDRQIREILDSQDDSGFDDIIEVDMDDLDEYKG